MWETRNVVFTCSSGLSEPRAALRSEIESQVSPVPGPPVGSFGPFHLCCTSQFDCSVPPAFAFSVLPFTPRPAPRAPISDPRDTKRRRLGGMKRRSHTSRNSYVIYIHAIEKSKR